MMEEVKQLISKMSLKEKIGQLTQTMFSKDRIHEIKAKAANGEIGSVILSSTAFAGNDGQEKSAIEILNDIQKSAVEESQNGIPILFGRDVIHGHKVVYPIPLAMAASFNPNLVKECYECIADEAVDDGIKWSFAPMLDISRDPRWGRCIESPGEDPYLGSCMASAVVNGFQKDNKMLACAKHYIGYGASEGGRDYHRTEISEYTLRNYYLKAFRSAVECGVGTVMSSFNDISGQPVTSSEYLIRGVLKDELGFNGFVVSDWGAIGQLCKQGVACDREQAAELALKAGIDMDMCDFCYEDYLESLVKCGKIEQKVIDEAVARVLSVKYKFGLFNKPYAEHKSYDVKMHLSKSEKMASESNVLLKNDGILPLKSEKISIALIGPMVNERRSHLGSWTLDGDVSLVPNVYEAIKKENPDATLFCADSELNDEMLINIRKSDVVIACLGESYKVTGEMHSLSNIDIPASQLELVKNVYLLGKPIVGVMFFGRPVALERIEPYLSGIIYSWHGGTMSACAAADIIFGKTNPSGRLPMTIPRRTGQIPLYYNVSSSGRPVNGYYGEEQLQNYDDCLGTPLYPFGYGLSYSTFSYSKLQVDKSCAKLEDIVNGYKFFISVSVENSGDYDGFEVVQLYVCDKIASMMRPIKELKSFKKVFINSGENVTVDFEVGFDELGFYNKDGKFVVEPGEFDIFVGCNSISSKKTCLHVLK